MTHKKCYSCQGEATTTTFAGSPGRRYEVSVCEPCKKAMAESDRDFAQLLSGFAEYNAYYDNKNK